VAQLFSLGHLTTLMNLTFLNRWAGLFSILWIPVGYFLVALVITLFPNADRRLYYLATYSWLGIGLLLSIVGFIRGSLAGRICAIIGFILLLATTVLLTLPAFAHSRL
jgi:hypothetical protein